MFNLNSTKTRQASPAVSPAPYKAQADNTMQNTDTINNPQINQRVEEIEAQRRAFAAKNPGFDMKAELKNPDFINYVWGKGLSVEDAYFLVHKNEILEQARSEAMEALLERRNRIQENGAGKNRPAIAKKNPKDLSDKEIDSIIERVKNGEKISF